MKYAIEILTLELWALKKRLHNYKIISHEIMATHPAIEETEMNIIHIESALYSLRKLED